MICSALNRARFMPAFLPGDTNLSVGYLQGGRPIPPRVRLSGDSLLESVISAPGFFYIYVVAEKMTGCSWRRVSSHGGLFTGMLKKILALLAPTG